MPEAIRCGKSGCRHIRCAPRLGQAVHAGVAYDRHPLIASDDLYSGSLGRRPASDAAVGPEEVVVQNHQAHKRGIVGPKSPGRPQPLLELAVEPLVAVVVIVFSAQVDLPDVNQPEAGPAPEGLPRRPAERLQAVCYEGPTGAAPAILLAAANRSSGS